MHRRAGKTVVAILFLLYRALASKGTYGYIAPYRSQCKNIAWEILLKFANQIPGTTFNISELHVTLPNWSRITLFGADNENALRGLDLKGVVLDEYADMSKTLYPEIVFPMINAHKDWWSVWIGTPKGYNIFYELYEKACASAKYYTLYLDVYATGLLDDEQIKDAKEEMTDENWDDSAFRQELLLDWDVAIKGSYYGKEISKLRKDGRIINHLYDPILPVFTAWDLGMNDETCILFFQYHEGAIRIFDYYSNRSEGFAHYKEVLDRKNYWYKMHYVPHDAQVKELGTGLTRLETLRQMFWYDKVEIIKRISVEDGINAVRRLFGKMWYDAGMEDYLNELSNYSPKIDKDWKYWKPQHSDLADTVRYLSIAYINFIEPDTYFESFTIDYDSLII